ncbi:MAG: chemotaxis-specific protein-glutamate methyltransferase CheB [candidate division WOR-3 bacterium]|nr:chemotaxis-specific protein-glutamate methyltransferase CheB [candidate division WOR-3 bacterium]
MKKKVLIVEDSVLMQRVIGDIIQSSGECDICGYARNVDVAWAKFNKLKPDVITLDYELPGENGLVFLQRVMSINPTPVLMLSAHTHQGAEITIKSLTLGAVDFFPKPSGPISIDLYDFKEELITKLRYVARANLKPIITEPRAPSGVKIVDFVIGIAASTGGVKALNFLLSSLRKEFGFKIVVVQHMPKFFTASLAMHLDEKSGLDVKEACNNDMILAGQVLIAPGGSHIKVHPSGRSVILTDEPPRHGLKPCADYLFESMAEVFKNKALGIVLTGMGHDGTNGLLKIKQMGGMTIVQEPSEATIASMPQSAIDAGAADFVLPLHLIAKKLMEIAG